MAKTPVSKKGPKTLNTPKTAPRNLKGTSSVKKDATKPAGVQRIKLDIEASTSIVSSICTPSRTTRSMARVLSKDMKPPSGSRPTPSMRKTISTPRPSAKKASTRSATEQIDDLNGDFVRPLPPKAKQLNLSHVDSVNDKSTDSASMDSNLNVGITRKSGRAQKSVKISKANVPTVTVTAVSSEDDSANVELSNTPGKFVKRSRKTIHKDKAEEIEEDDLPSVSMLGETTIGDSVRTKRKTINIQEVAAVSSDEDLPSVSFLGENVSDSEIKNDTKKRKSKLSLNGKSDLKQDNTSIGTRKSTSNDQVMAETKEDKNTPVRRSAKMTPNARRNSSTKQSAKLTPAKSSPSPLVKSDVEMKEEVNIEIVENGELKNKISDEEKPSNGMIAEVGVKSTEDNHLETAELQDEVKDLPKTLKRKSLVKNKRISVIDLTESPVVGNRSVLNKTFSPEKETDDKSNDVKDGTFTEETDVNKTAVNDKTFSPLPSSTAKKSAIKHVLLPPPAYSPMPLKLTRKSIGKKKSPQLKRLQGTPMGKPNSRHNLNTSAKMSSAKKVKMVEAATELVNQKKITSVQRDSPFKFGDHKVKDHPFRFSLMSECLKSKDPLQNISVPDKSNKKVKPAPNFGDMHSRLFNKAESIDETRHRHEHRAKLLLSGKKPTNAQKKAEKSMDVMAPKLKNDNKSRGENEVRRPLAHVNRARLNDEERQDRRRQLFKNGPNPVAKKTAAAVSLKGVRLNRRFELMMANRNKSNRK